MNALQAMKMQLNVARTENGDLAYKSTGSACLDFFSLCGGMRRNLEDLDKLFAKAYAENPVVAIIQNFPASTFAASAIISALELYTWSGVISNPILTLVL